MLNNLKIEISPLYYLLFFLGKAITSFPSFTDLSQSTLTTEINEMKSEHPLSAEMSKTNQPAKHLQKQSPITYGINI